MTANLRLHLTPQQTAGPIGKTISRCGADAMVAHADAGDALEHIDIFSHIDLRGDALRRVVARLINQARHTSSAAERESLLRTAAVYLAQVDDLDDLEDEHIRVYATERIVTAREACFRVVDVTERALRRVPEADVA